MPPTIEGPKVPTHHVALLIPHRGRGHLRWTSPHGHVGHRLIQTSRRGCAGHSWRRLTARCSTGKPMGSLPILWGRWHSTWGGCLGEPTYGPLHALVGTRHTHSHRWRCLDKSAGCSLPTKRRRQSNTPPGRSSPSSPHVRTSSMIRHSLVAVSTFPCRWGSDKGNRGSLPNRGPLKVSASALRSLQTLGWTWHANGALWCHAWRVQCI